jgi:hypothetical protein
LGDEEQAVVAKTLDQLLVLLMNAEPRVARYLSRAEQCEQSGDHHGANQLRARAECERLALNEDNWPGYRRLLLMLESEYGQPGLTETNIRRLRARLVRDGLTVEQLSALTLEQACDLIARWPAPQNPSARDNMHVAASSGPEVPPADLEVVPGGFLLWATRHKLSGKPQEMLRMLLTARGRCCTADELRAALWSDETTTYPEQAVRDTAKDLRQTLRIALQAEGVNLDNLQRLSPLLSSGKGKDLSYGLELPPRPPRQR